MEEERGGKKTILVGRLPISILDDTQKFRTIRNAEQKTEKYLTHIKVQRVVIDGNCI